MSGQRRLGAAGGPGCSWPSRRRWPRASPFCMPRFMPGSAADYPYYAPLGALVAMYENVAGSMRQGLQTLVGLAIGIGLAFMLFSLGDPTPGDGRDRHGRWASSWPACPGSAPAATGFRRRRSWSCWWAATTRTSSPSATCSRWASASPWASSSTCWSSRRCTSKPRPSASPSCGWPSPGSCGTWARR